MKTSVLTSHWPCMPVCTCLGGAASCVVASGVPTSLDVHSRGRKAHACGAGLLTGGQSRKRKQDGEQLFSDLPKRKWLGGRRWGISLQASGHRNEPEGERGIHLMHSGHHGQYWITVF